MDATSEASGPLLTGSALASRGREARTISIFLGASFSAGGSWVIVGGFMALGDTPWLAFFSFSMTLGCSTFSGGLSKEVGTLALLFLPISATSEGVLVLESEGTDSQMVGGSTHSLPS